MSWPTIETITSERLLLEPLSVDHAPEMVKVLAEVSIYEYTGGEAPSLEQLQLRYEAQAVGHSPDRSQGWFNWIVKPRGGGTPLGFVQATLGRRALEVVANIAWVISPAHQGQGMASEGARAMVRWLQRKGVTSLEAYIHPEHHASTGVARNLGLHPTEVTDGFEIRWESQRTSSDRRRTAYFRDRTLGRVAGYAHANHDSNFFDVETGNEYWISGPKRNRTDGRYGKAQPSIDADVLDEYRAFPAGAPLPGRESG